MTLRSWLRPLACLLFCAPLAAGCGAPPREDAAPADAAAAQAAIGELNRAFMDAFARDDTLAVAAMYAEGAALLPPNADFQRGQDAIVAFWGAALTPAIKDLVLESDEVIAQGDQASEVGRWTMTKPDGSTLDHGKYIVLWRRVDGAWKIHRDMWNSSEPQPPAAGK